MGFRDQCASSVAPIFLRVALGVTFIWAGAGKVFKEGPVSGEDAAILANLGVVAAAPKTAPTPATPAPVIDPAPASTPTTPPAAPADAGKTSGGPPALMRLVQTTPDGSTPTAGGNQLGPAAATGSYTAEDFPSTVNVRMVHFLTLSLVRSAHPADNKMPLWPPPLAQGRWPVYLAWAVALTELVGGCWLVLGLFTRFAAFGIAGVMLGAMWLSQFGPAIHAKSTYLGFIPKHGAFEMNNCGMPLYMTLMWQFMLFCGAMALFFTGSGALAVDRALFGRSSPSKPVVT